MEPSIKIVPRIFVLFNRMCGKKVGAVKKSGGYTWSFAFDFFVTDALSLTFVWKSSKRMRGCV